MRKYTASVIAAGCLWGLMGLFTRTLAACGVDATGAIVLRCGIAALLFGATILVRDPKQFRIRLRDFWCFFGTGICSLLFFTYCYFQAITIMDLSTAGVLLYTAPSIVMVLSLLLFHERITAQKLVALVLAFAGCCLVSLVGVGLPQVNPRQEMLRRYYDAQNGAGFDYAYRYPGMNKVLQAAGRVIRTPEDKGVVLLLDDRFAKPDYQRLFPLHWKHLQYLPGPAALETALADFWSSKPE